MKAWNHWKQLKAFHALPAHQRRLVFYSEGPSYWTHFQPILEQLLSQVEEPFCFVSSDSNDPGLHMNHPLIKGFCIGEGGIRTLFFKGLRAKVLVMTMPDLNVFYIKRSVYPVHYVYIQHSLVSTHMVYHEKAFDFFDTIFCAGPHHMKEIREHEKHYDLKAKALFAHGYGRLDALKREYAHTLSNDPKSQKGPPYTVLVAPSWGKHGVIETLGAPLVNRLLTHGFKVKLRPHPQTLKLASKSVRKIVNAFASHPDFVYETNVSSMTSLFEADIMISDWSGAAIEFALALEKPVIFVDVPKKIRNPNFEALGIVPLEDRCRAQLGAIISPDALDQLPEQVTRCLEDHTIGQTLNETLTQTVFNIGCSAQKGADHLLTICHQIGEKHG